jgi:hypothetical protein
MLPTRSTRAALALTATLLAAAAPAAQAGQDLRSPDARDAAGHPQVPYYSSYGSDATRAQDLRSPDARDAARGNLTSPPSVRVVRVVETAPTGFSWADAGIGAATSFGLVLLVAGGFIGVSRHRLRTT